MTTSVKGETPDGAPHVGKVPGKQSQWILAGFNGGGNALAFLCAEAVAKMALDDLALGDAGVDIPPFSRRRRSVSRCARARAWT